MKKKTLNEKSLLLKYPNIIRKRNSHTYSNNNKNIVFLLVLIKNFWKLINRKNVIFYVHSTYLKQKIIQWAHSIARYGFNVSLSHKENLQGYLSRRKFIQVDLQICSIRKLYSWGASGIKLKRNISIKGNKIFFVNVKIIIEVRLIIRFAFY